MNIDEVGETIEKAKAIGKFHWALPCSPHTWLLPMDLSMPSDIEEGKALLGWGMGGDVVRENSTVSFHFSSAHKTKSWVFLMQCCKYLFKKKTASNCVSRHYNLFPSFCWSLQRLGCITPSCMSGLGRRSRLCFTFMVHITLEPFHDLVSDLPFYRLDWTHLFLIAFSA